jgi:hypothetical protein
MEIAPDHEKLVPISHKTIRRCWSLLKPALAIQLEDFIAESSHIVIGSDGSTINGYAIFSFMLQNEKNEFIGFDFVQLPNEQVPTVLAAFKTRFSDLKVETQYALARKVQGAGFN